MCRLFYILYTSRFAKIFFSINFNKYSLFVKKLKNELRICVYFDLQVKSENIGMGLSEQMLKSSIGLSTSLTFAL